MFDFIVEAQSSFCTPFQLFRDRWQEHLVRLTCPLRKLTPIFRSKT